MARLLARKIIARAAWLYPALRAVASLLCGCLALESRCVGRLTIMFGL